MTTELNPFGSTHTLDMSSEAIDQRLRDLGQLHALAMSLQSVTFLGPLAACTGSTTPVTAPQA